MQIDLSDSGCLTLLLSDEELEAMGLSFEELDYRCPKTRRMVRTLLQLAQNETGYAPEGSLLVEALPLAGGCLLLVTPRTALPHLCEREEPVAFFVTEDGLLQLAAAWQEDAHPFGESSSLYRDEQGFWLIMYGGADAPALYECAEPVAEGDAAVAFVAEHATPVFIGDALPQLHRAVRGDL